MIMILLEQIDKRHASGELFSLQSQSQVVGAGVAIARNCSSVSWRSSWRLLREKSNLRLYWSRLPQKDLLTCSALAASASSRRSCLSQLLTSTA